MLVDVKIQNDVLNLPKQCYNLLVDRCAAQNRFCISAFSEKGDHFQIALISKRFETTMGLVPNDRTFEVVSESHRFFLPSIAESVFITI